MKGRKQGCWFWLSRKEFFSCVYLTSVCTICKCKIPIICISSFEFAVQIDIIWKVEWKLLKAQIKWSWSNLKYNDPLNNFLYSDCTFDYTIWFGSSYNLTTIIYNVKWLFSSYKQCLYQWVGFLKTNCEHHFILRIILSQIVLWVLSNV